MHHMEAENGISVNTEDWPYALNVVQVTKTRADDKFRLMENWSNFDLTDKGCINYK